MSSPIDAQQAGVVVLDDDPTGTQCAADVPVVVDVSKENLESWFGTHRAGPAYVLTNARALGRAEARDTVERVAKIARAEWPDAELVLRADSTLRGHLVEEYQAVADGGHPPLLLVPAMPAAGRITVGGWHYLVRDGERVLIGESEYARDPDFRYSRSDLLGWAEERSGGLFPAAAGQVVDLGALRRNGPEVVRRALVGLSRAERPAVCVTDIETDDDLVTVAEGLAAARAIGVRVAVRCAPPLAAMVAGCLARGLVPPPPVGERILVVVGSYVPTTTTQLAELERRYPGTATEVDVAALVEDAGSEQRRLAKAVAATWGQSPVAVLATPRRSPIGSVLPRGVVVATNLARVVGQLDEAPTVVVAKGGITAAMTVREGLSAREAWVAGPVRPGIALWHVEHARERSPFIVFAGNVGGPGTLADLVADLAGG